VIYKTRLAQTGS